MSKPTSSVSCKINKCKNQGHLDNRTGRRYFTKGLCSYHYNYSWFKAQPIEVRRRYNSRSGSEGNKLMRRVANDLARRTFGHIDIKLISNYYTRICGICGYTIEHSFEVDHIVPISRNGTGTIDNLQLAHPICNRVKSNRLQSELSADDIMTIQEFIKG